MSRLLDSRENGNPENRHCRQSSHNGDPNRHLYCVDTLPHPKVAETLANAAAVIPVKTGIHDFPKKMDSCSLIRLREGFTGMTVGHKRLSPENRDISVKIFTPPGRGKFCK